MKQFTALLLTVLLLLSLFGCSSPGESIVQEAASPSEAAAVPEAIAAPDIVVFSDEYFEEAVRTALNKPDGDITIAETEAIAVLDVSNADWDAMNAENGGIKDISDLKYFPNLTELHLDFNNIQDFTPLSALTKLTALSFNAVQVSDLSPLSSLTNMVNICFNWNYAPDQGVNGYESIGFVENMKDLEIFEARNAGIKDISPLAGLPKLWSVFISDNQITDISPLAQIKTLQEFSIANNPIEDYSSLEPMREVFPNLWPDFQPDVELD